MKYPFAMLLAFATIGCGSRDVIKLHRSFEIYIDPKTPDQIALTEFLHGQVDIFNQEVGFKALKIVDSKVKGTSTFQFYSKDAPIKGHETAIGVCGPRQVDIETNTKFAPGSLDFVKEIIRKDYMECAFQQEYFNEAKVDLDDPTSGKYFQYQRVLNHEIGHGLGFNHNQRSESDVMSPTIKDNENPDKEKFFQEVRDSFFKN